jgi:hypothetical protein
MEAVLLTQSDELGIVEQRVVKFHPGRVAILVVLKPLKMFE